MNVQKQARRDAVEFAKAQMAYGEGAGTRRKLIRATVDSKVAKSGEYARAFQDEIGRQDMAKLAVEARRDRLRKDTTEVVGKNAKGLLTGNYKAVNTSVLVVITSAYFVHQFGWDRVMYEKARKKWYRIRAKQHYNKINKGRLRK